MIGYLKGTVLEITADGCMVLVAGIGYEVSIPAGMHGTLTTGREVALYVHAVYREDARMLFGFARAKSKVVFKMLLGAQGVGPKLALGIIGAMPVEVLVSTIVEKNVGMFKGVKGVGPRLAEKLVTDLAPKFSKLSLTQEAEGGLFSKAQDKKAQSSVLSDVLLALEGLGYSGAYVREEVLALYAEEKDLKVLLKKSLARLAQPS